MKKSIRSVFLAFVFLMAMVSGCAPAPTPTPVPPTFTLSPIPPTFTPEPTATETPIPSPTPLPQVTLIPVSEINASVISPTIVVEVRPVVRENEMYTDKFAYIEHKNDKYVDKVVCIINKDRNGFSCYLVYRGIADSNQSTYDKIQFFSYSENLITPTDNFFLPTFDMDILNSNIQATLDYFSTGPNLISAGLVRLKDGSLIRPGAHGYNSLTGQLLFINP